MLTLEFGANHSCIGGVIIYSHMSDSLLVPLSNQLKRNDYPPPPSPPRAANLFWRHLGAPGELAAASTSSPPLAARQLCDVSRGAALRHSPAHLYARTGGGTKAVGVPNYPVLKK